MSGPTLVFALRYRDVERPGTVRPMVVWMWAVPVPGVVVDITIATKRGREQERYGVVSTVLYTHGSEGPREYAGEVLLAPELTRGDL